MVYCAVPSSETLNRPFSAPTLLVGCEVVRGGKSFCPPFPSGTWGGEFTVCATHCPSPVHELPLAQDPQLWPQLGSAPHWRPSQRGAQVGHWSPHCAPAKPQSGGLSTMPSQERGRHALMLPSPVGRQASPTGHWMLFVH